MVCSEEGRNLYPYTRFMPRRADSARVVDFAVLPISGISIGKNGVLPCQVHLEVLHAFLFQFQAPFEQMFDDKANVTQVRMQKQAFEVRAIRCSERPGAGDVGFEGFNR